MNFFAAADVIRSRPWIGYPLAVCLSLAALSIRFGAGDLLVGFPFLTFFSAVVLSAFLGGLGPGVLAAVLGGLLSNYFLIPPEGDLRLTWPSGVIGMGFYVFTVTVIVGLIQGMIWASERQRTSDEALRRLNAELEARVAERTAANACSGANPSPKASNSDRSAGGGCPTIDPTVNIQLSFS